MSSPNSGIPYVPEGTLDPAAGLNDSIDVIDALLQCAVVRMDLTAPPGTGPDGARYIVASPATGAWAGHENDLARYVAEGDFWQFFTAGEQVHIVLNLDDLTLYRFDTESPATWRGVDLPSVQDSNSPVGIVAGAAVLKFGSGFTVTEETGGVALIEGGGGGGGSGGTSLTVTDEDSPQFIETDVEELVVVGDVTLSNPSPGVVRIEVGGPTTDAARFSDMRRRVMWAQADGSNTFNGGFDTVGSLPLSVAQAASHPSLAATNLLTSTVRQRQTTSANTNQNATWFSNVAVNRWYRSVSGSALAGGFDFFCRVGLETIAAGNRIFVGMLTGTAAPTASSDPSAFVNMAGLAKDAADTNVQFMHNDGSGTATKVDLGVAFTALADHVLEVTLHCEPNGSEIEYDIFDVDAATHYTGSVNTNLPAQDAILGPVAHCNTGSSSAAVVFDFMRVVVAADR